MTNFDSVSPPSSASRGMELFTQPIEIFLWLNAGVINVFQSATVSWMQRRQEAARDAIASFEKLVHSRDFGEAMTIQREWIKRSTRRLDEDFSSLKSRTPDIHHEAETAGASAIANESEAAQLEAARVPVREGEERTQIAESTGRARSTQKKASNHRPKPVSSPHKRRR